MNKIDIINNHVISNIESLKAICRAFYKGSYLWEDLFQEFYLQIVKVPDDLYLRFQVNLKALCYLTIRDIHNERRLNKSGLEGSRKIIFKQDLNNYELSCCQPEYVQDILDYIEKEKNKPHNFADIVVFTETMEKSLRELNKETGISIFSLCRYRQAGQAKLQRLLA